MPAYTGKTQKLTPDQLAWWQRSDGTTHANEAQRVTSKDDWTQDFLAEHGAEVARVPTAAADKSPAIDDWSRDFGSPNATKQPNTPENQWSDDFEPKD